MTTRRRLANRREHHVIAFAFRGVNYIAGYSRMDH